MRSGERTGRDLAEITRRGFEAGNRGDFDAMTSLLGPDCVWELVPWGLGTYEGLAAIRRFLEDWIGSFDEYHLLVEEMLDVGNEVVFVVATQYAHSPGSRGYLRLRSASVVVWADGVIVRVTNYHDIDEGRAAAQRLAESRE